MPEPSLYIGKRYASLRSGTDLVSFISLMSVGGLALGVAILVTVLSVMNGFDRELRERILALVPHITVSSARNQPLMSVDEWAPLRASLHEVEGIVDSAPLLQLQGMLLAGGKSKGVLLNGIDPEEERRVSVIDNFVSSGSLDALQAGEFSIAIGAGLAEHLGLAVGDRVTLVSTVVPITPLGESTRQKTFHVGAIFHVGSDIDSSLALVHMADAQLLYRLGNRIHGYRLQTDDLFAAYAIQQQLLRFLPDTMVLSDWTQDYGNIHENIRLSKTMVGLLLTMLVAVAAYNIVVSLIMVVHDKQGNIAILRAMGASRGVISRIFLVQGMLIGLVGTLIGIFAGIAMALSAGSAVSWLEAWTGVTLLSADVYPVNYLPSELRLSDILLVAALALSLTLLATLYPSAQAARARPAEILRHE